MELSGSGKMKEGKITALNLTDEQKMIIASSGNIKINAVAGSGKTTTIIKYAASRPAGCKILYLAFNRSVKLEAMKRFENLGLNNVQVETAHSLAYRYIVKGSDYNICQSDYKMYEIAEILDLKGSGERHGEYILANHIKKFVTYFCNSAAKRVQDLNYLDIVIDPKAKNFVSSFYKQIEYGTRLLLKKMEEGEIEISHDFYLKKFQLSNPVLPFDYILFDEGQDASAAMLDIFFNQPATKVIVGDTHQQIYSWRHAVNSLEKADFKNFDLSTSFRFNQEIANLSMETLKWKNHLYDYSPVNIIGKGILPLTNTKATIARTNLGLLLKAITFITEHRNVRGIYFEGNITSYTYADEGASLYDVLNLYNSRHDRIRDKLIASMKNMEELEDYIEKTEDVQLGLMVEIVKEYQNEIPSLIKSLKNKHVGDKYKDSAEMIFSTVHRAKGMEYDEIELVSDFVTESKIEKLKEEEKDQLGVAKWNEEINLLYVAITRTKKLLKIPEVMMPREFPKSSSIIITNEKKNDKVKDDSFPEFLHSKQKNKVGKRPVKIIGGRSIPTSYSLEEKRLDHKNAYKPWSTELDVELKTMYYNGVELSKICHHFERNRGAILSRLRKLGCVN